MFYVLCRPCALALKKSRRSFYILTLHTTLSAQARTTQVHILTHRGGVFNHSKLYASGALLEIVGVKGLSNANLVICFHQKAFTSTLFCRRTLHLVSGLLLKTGRDVHPYQILEHISDRERHGCFAMGTSLGANWFHTWADEESYGKSFHLQVELEGLSVHTHTSPYVKLSQSSHGISGPWRDIGQTSVVSDEKDPAFAEGFRILYEQSTDLTAEMVKAEVWHHRDGLMPDERVGEASVSLMELFRTFGTKVKVEILKQKSDKIVGRIQFLGEKLPTSSPRGGKNSFSFKMKVETPPSQEISSGHGTFAPSRLFVLVSREREDGSWGIVHRTGYFKTGSTRMSQKLKSKRKSYLIVPRFTLNQGEMLLGEGPERPIRMQVVMHGRKDEKHTVIGTSVLSVDELLNDLFSETSVDFCADEEIVGEFAVMERRELVSLGGATAYTYEIQINRFDEEEDAKKYRQALKKKNVNLNSP